MSVFGGRLTALKVKHAREPGMLADGNGLYLQVTRANARSWIFRYHRNGKSREMGLGSLSAIGLADARLKAAECRRLLADGIDPIAARDAERSQLALEAARAITFDKCADAFIKAHASGWKNQKHVKQWTATIRSYVSPVFGSLPVQAVDVTLVMKVLEPLWTTKPETATRIRGRIESVLDWAKARGYRTGENPALWKGHLDKLLPSRNKVAKVVHHSALPYDELPEFMAALREQDSISARALEFTILTAARTGEIIGARRSEIDEVSAAWTIPAKRMKGDREHRVPLSARALEIFRNLPKDSDYLFPGGRAGNHLSNMAMLKLLERMKRDDLTVHGFRSTFRDWAAERTNFPGEVAEAALAHAVGDKVEAAYRRGDLFEKRRRLMEAWAQFATTASSDPVVVSFREATV
jgi:integrase